MKFKINVTGEAALGLPEQDFELDAEDGHEAANVAREHLHNVSPKEGGLLTVTVEALEPWTTEQKHGQDIVRITKPAGVCSEFSFKVEPHESVRAEVEKKQAEAEAAAAKAAERAAIESEILEKLRAEGRLVESAEVSK